MASHNFFLSAVSLIITFFLFIAAPSTSAATTIGATYSAASSDTCPPSAVASAVSSLGLAALRLDDPKLVGAFLHSNTSLLLTIPNSLVPSFADNRSAALLWLHAHVVPFHPRVTISAISVGSDFLTSDHSSLLLPAILNLHLSLLDLGIRHVSVSTTFSFGHVITSPFPPSSAAFIDAPPLNAVIRPLLQFLSETNSSFHVIIHPFHLYRLRSEISVGFALFQDHPYSFRDDTATGARYRNLFDVMLDGVVSAMAAEGHESIPIVVSETGWPSWSDDPREVEANPIYAQLYVKGLLGHIKSGRGSPLKGEGAAQVNIHALVDESVERRSWGILFGNLTDKYKGVDYRSERSTVVGGSTIGLRFPVGASICTLLVLGFLLYGGIDNRQGVEAEAAPQVVVQVDKAEQVGKAEEGRQGLNEYPWAQEEEEDGIPSPYTVSKNKARDRRSREKASKRNMKKPGRNLAHLMEEE